MELLFGHNPTAVNAGDGKPGEFLPSCARAASQLTTAKQVPIPNLEGPALPFEVLHASEVQCGLAVICTRAFDADA